MKVGNIAVTALCATTVLATAACSSSSGGNSSSSGTGSGSGSGSGGGSSSSSSSSGSGFKAALIIGQKGAGFYTNMICGASAEAKKFGIDLTSSGAAEFTPAQQLPLINAALAGQPKVLVVVPTDPTALNPVLTQAKQSGTKIITADTTLKGDGIASAAVTSDNEMAGRQGADQLAKLMGEKGTAVAISNPPGITTSGLRRKGFLEQMKGKHPGITVLPVEYNDTTAQKSASLVNAVLAAHPGLTGVYATDDVGGIGAGTAVRNANLTKKVNVVGTDADPGLVGQLKSGEIDALVTQRPDIQGAKAIEFAQKIVKGQAVPKLTLVPTLVVTRENLSSPVSQQSIYKNSCG